MKKARSVLFVVSECVPFAKTGGLADVARGAAHRARARGHDVRVVLPRYRVTKKPRGRAASRAPLAVPLGARRGVVRGAGRRPPAPDARGVPARARRALRSRRHLRRQARRLRRQPGALRAALAGGAAALQHLDFEPDVIHAHDWQTSLVPVYLNTARGRLAARRARPPCSPSTTSATRAWFGKDQLWQTRPRLGRLHARGWRLYDSINLLKGGSTNATLVTTVSPRYAREIQNAARAARGSTSVLRDRGGDVIGVLNGIDETRGTRRATRTSRRPSPPRISRARRPARLALQREMGLLREATCRCRPREPPRQRRRGSTSSPTRSTRSSALDAQVVVLGAGERTRRVFPGALSARSGCLRMPRL